MKIRRPLRRSSPRTLILLVAGLAVGTVAALQVKDQIREARDSGMFAPPVPVAVRSAPAKPTEADARMGVVLAAASGMREPDDCLSLAPEHRPGCRAYVERRREEGPVLR